jgi:cell division septation protein DedD
MATGNIKNFELKVGKAGLITIVVGMVALLSTAFLFGIEVGKNIDVYPEKIAAFPQKILGAVWRPAKIKAAQSTSENKSAQNKTQSQENIDLTFYNDLTGKKGSVNEEAIPDRQSTFSELPVGNFNIDVQKPAETVVSGKSKEKGELKEKKITPLPVASKEKFIIQVASLKDKNKANKIVKKIDSLGFTSQVVKVETKKKGTFFRVIIPGFETKFQAQEAAQKISQKTTINCIIKSVDNGENKD